MDTYKTKWTRLQCGIFRFLCIRAGMKFNGRGIAKELKVSPTAVANALPELEKEGLIRVEKSKTMNLFSIEFNRDNRNAIDLKRVENLKQIYESGLISFLEEKFAGGTIILFGSYSLGWDVSKSDIDIAIIGRKDKTIDLGRYEKLLDRKITINFYPSFKDIHKHLRNNILNGILLSGGIEL
ncbi:MAG: nucleotidyltransferase domain-containing protein [Nanoarchaeota archaeon]|nr:nucleotidyltransferase domain-containing protein [Nanoarchaeota archaeon]MBU1103658.1 nucleotidyltransferase domain-containing protein [Nanoarchaeota archaeon]